MLLSDFVEINPSMRLRKGMDHSCVMMDDVTPGRRYVSPAITRVYKGGSVFRTGDTLFARITPSLENGKIAQFLGSKDEIAFGSTEFLVFRHREGVSDPSYIFYLALTDTIRRPAEKSMFGASGRQRVDVGVIRQIEVPAPPLPTQRKIAAILSAYDDLIENKTRRIAILEEMARLIYREWFVEFRYPGHQGKKVVESALGPIPEGWEACPIGSVIETLGGGTPSTKEPKLWEDGDVTWFTPSDLTAAKTVFITDSSKRITALGLRGSSARLFPPRSVMMTSRATIGVVAINTKEACTNQGFVTCVPNQRLSAYQIYFWIEQNKDLIMSVASGATYKEISRGEFRDLLVTIADTPTNERFQAAQSPIMAQIETLQRKNINLRRTRDLLLPRLMSGELDVSELEIHA